MNPLDADENANAVNAGLAAARRGIERRDLRELEDAILGYFAGGYPVGSCPDRATAETRLKAAAADAAERLGLT